MTVIKNMNLPGSCYSYFSDFCGEADTLMQFVYLRDLHRQAWIQILLWLLDWPWLAPELLCSSSLGVILGQGLAETPREGPFPGGSSSQHGIG